MELYLHSPYIRGVAMKFSARLIIPVHSQLTERGHLRSASLDQLCTYPTMLPLLEHFWKSCCGIDSITVITFFFGCIQYPEMFIPLRQTLFLETARSHSEPNQGNRVGVSFQ
jgi:hypothetical protein